MAFTRFTSGRTGNLTFSLLNEIMDRIESLEQPRGSLGYNGQPYQPPFLAKVIGQSLSNPLHWAFDEFTYPDTRVIGNAVKVEGGRSSRTQLDQYSYPLIGSGFTVGELIMVFAMYDGASKLVYHPLKPGSGTAINGLVTAAAVVTANVRWRYTVQPVLITNATTGATSNVGSTVQAFNGAEFVADTTTVKGVGAIPPVGPTYTRKAIRNGTGVVINQDANGNWMFSVPNGYEVVCP